MVPYRLVKYEPPVYEPLKIEPLPLVYEPPVYEPLKIEPLPLVKYEPPTIPAYELLPLDDAYTLAYNKPGGLRDQWSQVNPDVGLAGSLGHHLLMNHPFHM